MPWLGGNGTAERGAALLLEALGATGEPLDSSTELDGNSTELNSSCVDCELTEAPTRQYWFLILILIPLLSVFGNVLVILAVWRERSLQSATNYFIVSLAVADLLVSAAVMPFAVYVQVNGIWGLPAFVCDLYIATDVTSSTSSIFNLVAISIDRYIAVTQPIKYAKHKNNNRVIFTIILVWVTSAAIGAPLVLGLNVPADGIPREEQQCIFYNSDFIIYSSLSSFYIPCVIMVCLYYRIFQAIRLRARQAAAAKRPKMDTRPSTVIENLAQTKQQETTLSVMRPVPDKATNTGSNSQDEDEEDDDEGQEDGPDISSPNDVEDCHIITNKSCAELPLVTLPMASPAGPSVMVVEANGHHDSGYVDDSNVNPLSTAGGTCAGPRDTLLPVRNAAAGKAQISGDNKLAGKKPTARGGPAKDKKSKRPTTSRFTIYKVNKASRKKREKNSAKRERKATKTLAIVLGVFLACWVPFFTCNVVDAICMKKGSDCSPGLMAFFFTTWIGYMNSFANPVIYTIFNLEFRKAFKRLLSCDR